MQVDIWQMVLAGVPLLLGIGVVANRVNKITLALKECSEFLSSIVVSFDDKELTKDEIKMIKQEGLEALAAIKSIFK